MNYQQLQYRFGNGTNISNGKVVCVEPKVLNDHQYRNGTSRNFRKHSCETAKLQTKSKPENPIPLTKAWCLARKTTCKGHPSRCQKVRHVYMISHHEIFLRGYLKALVYMPFLLVLPIFCIKCIKFYLFMLVHTRKNKFRIIFVFHFSCNRPVGIPCSIM